MNIPDNDSITWHGNRFGYQPELPDEITKLLNDKEPDKAELLSALSDIQKFVAAHVILTLLSGAEYETFPTWNKLKIEIHADGKAEIPPEQRFFLAEFWRDRT